MNYEISCGAVVFSRVNGGVRYLIIESREGIFGFPKGHMEGKETEIETAKREIFEETGLKPDFIDGFRAENEYPLPRKKGVIKKVVYFLAEFSEQKIVPQEKELNSARLLSFEEAMDILQFENAKEVLKKADDFIKRNILGDKIMIRKELAVEKHKKGYNCAQAVLCAFADMTDFEENELFRLSEAFGGGMGTKGVCGAVSAMVFLAGLKNSKGLDSLPASNKIESYASAKKLIEAFEKKNGTIICEKIKGEELRSCDGCIEDAVEILEELL